MADCRSSNAATLHRLSPGALFHPSEEQLICFYLASKNSLFPRHGVDVIKEIDLYKYDPFDLPESACFQYGKGGKKKHWYCYVRRLDENPRLRAAANGFWIKGDGVRNVIDGGAEKVVVGTRKTFVFYLMKGNNTSARKTAWVMHEYELTGHPKGSFVLCRVFVKSDPGKNISDGESIPASCENTVETELRLGVQHENAVTLHHGGFQNGGAVIGEGNEENGIDDTDEIYNLLLGQASELQDQNFSNPVAEQMRPFNDAAWATMDGLANQQLAPDIFTDDFVELNDLKWPLHGLQ